VAQLEQFLEKIKADTYPEPPSGQHAEITAKMMDHVFRTCALPQGARVLDIGCGHGVALQHFVARGCDATGVTLNAVDVETCQRQGYQVLEMDQSFLDFPEEQFDLVWCRHCLEHSIFPYFTLHEFGRVLSGRLAMWKCRRRIQAAGINRTAITIACWARRCWLA
jgi:SAM-dependent methyltransferase